MEIEKIVEEIDIEELKEMVEEVNNYNGQLEEYRYYENNEDFFDDNYYNRPFEAVRDAQDGSYNYNDEYVRFDGYGSLESASEYEIEDNLQDNAQEIVEAYVDIIDKVCNSDLKNKIEELLEPKMTKDEVYDLLRNTYHLCNTTTVKEVKEMYKRYGGNEDLSIGKQIDYVYKNILINRIYTGYNVDSDIIHEILKELKIEGE